MMSVDSKPYPFPNGLHLFGQLVIGPPGSGKTTYCAAMHDFLVKLGQCYVHDSFRLMQSFWYLLIYISN